MRSDTDLCLPIWFPIPVVSLKVSRREESVEQFIWEFAVGIGEMSKVVGLLQELRPALTLPIGRDELRHAAPCPWQIIIHRLIFPALASGNSKIAKTTAA